MALKTSLPGRVKNLHLPKNHSLLPLLEAVVNGIQAIDARFGDDMESGRLHVRILREPQTEIDLASVAPGRTPLRAIVGFSIEDNGEGFTPANMASFETLDSDYKAAIGCRGVGRLLWLKAFDRVSVRSVYEDESGELRGRQFRFSVQHEVEQDAAPEDGTDTGAFVTLDGFKKDYQVHAPKSVEAIAHEVFEHCIWYFLRPGGAPDIVVSDEDGQSVALRNLLDDSGYSATTTSHIVVKGEKFDMLNIHLRSSTRNATPRLHWCAADRVVKDESIAGKVLGLYGRLKDEQGVEFTYVCYLTSKFLDDNVRSDRTDFDIAERVPGEPLFDDLSIDDIREGVLAEVESILSEPLNAARLEGKERVHDFVSTRAPRYRPVLARLEKLGVTVDPSIKDQELELLLHRSLQKVDLDLIAQGQTVLAKIGAEPLEDFEEQLDEFLEAVTEVNQSDLAAYVFRRRKILDYLGKLIRTDDNGKYSREEAIHKLIIPMRKDSTELGSDAANLWIIDERLAFHDYLASDKTLKSVPITDSDSTREPDILSTRLMAMPVLASEGERFPLPSINVIELKRPMRADATEDKNPITQCLDYVKRVRAGGMKTATGRPISATPGAPAFCYIIADLTEKMIERCETSDLQKTYDGQGYFGYNRAAEAYIEVIGFDGLVNAAEERNRAFFDRLGLPSS